MVLGWKRHCRRGWRTARRWWRRSRGSARWRRWRGSSSGRWRRRWWRWHPARSLLFLLLVVLAEVGEVDITDDERSLAVRLDLLPLSLALALVGLGRRRGHRGVRLTPCHLQHRDYLRMSRSYSEQYLCQECSLCSAQHAGQLHLLKLFLLGGQLVLRQDPLQVPEPDALHLARVRIGLGGAHLHDLEPERLPLLSVPCRHFRSQGCAET